MLCTRCGEREAERVIYVEAGPAGKPPRSSPEERRAREEELNGLCERCLIDVTVPPEHRLMMQRLMDDQRAMYAAASATPVSEALPPLLVALEAETTRNPVDVVVLRKRLTELLQFLVSPEGRTLANFDATRQQLDLSSLSNLPALEREILLALSGSTMQALWHPELPGARELLPERLLARLQGET